MVNSIEPIDSAKAIQQIKPIEDMTANAQVSETLQQEVQPVTSDSFETKQSAFADYQIKDYVATYVNNLIAKYEGYDDIISRLRSYLGNFNIDIFRQTYPDILSNSDLATALYNDTLKFL